MARGSDQAKQGATSAQNISSTSSANAAGLYGNLAPQLETEAAHPPGLAPSDLSAINTAGQESAGGSMAGAVGQGGLQAARTRNAGGADAAIADSARSSSQALSKGALGTQMANAALKEKQHQSGLSGLESLYGSNLGSSVGALGQVAGNVNADTSAKDASWNWAKYILDPALQAGGQAAAAAGRG